MGLSPRELAELTPFQFELKAKGFARKNISTENYFRKLAFHLYVINTPPKTKVDIDDIWPNADTVKKATQRNMITKSKVQKTLEAFKKQRGLT